ncbi:hypothetical protein [Streptomyces sp. SID486]|nr:hypothetical protein [Streptomyces sp. SID486]
MSTRVLATITGPVPTHAAGPLPAVHPGGLTDGRGRPVPWR